MKIEPPNQFRIGIEECRKLKLPSRLATVDSDGMNGLFYVPVWGEFLRCIVSDELGWEHVSVSLRNRTPTWYEMCIIKGFFWDAEECVMQYHPPKSEYVNNHPYCLHLWKPVGIEIPRPPQDFVGIKSP